MERLRRPRQTVTFTLQTNGTLLNDEWGRFLANHQFLVGLSVDGPAHLHDMYRVNKAGRGTHAQVLRGLQVLQRHSVDTNVLCAVHSANQDAPLEVYRYFRDELGLRHIQFIPIVERIPNGQLVAYNGRRVSNGRRPLYRQVGNDVTSRSVAPITYGTFLATIFDEWSSRDVGTVFVRDFDGALSNFFGRSSLCVHAPECGSAVAVEWNGDIYSCDHYVEPDYLLGNVVYSRLASVINSSVQREFGRSKKIALPQQCIQCPVRWACHGGCPKDRFTVTHDGQPGLNYLCEGYRAFFSHAQPVIERIGQLLHSGRQAADVMVEQKSELTSILSMARRS